MKQSAFFTAKLLTYDLTKPHLFIDDAHACVVQSNGGVSSADVRNFFEQLYVKSRNDPEVYRWILIDITQECDYNSKDPSINVLVNENKKPIKSFRTVELNHVLRNSREIGECVVLLRKGASGKEEELNIPPDQLVDAQCAHTKHGAKVKVHYLTATTGSDEHDSL